MADLHVLDALAQRTFQALDQVLEVGSRFLAGLALGFVLQIAQIQPATRHRLQRRAVEFLQVAEHPLVHPIRQQQHLDALLAEDLQVRALACAGLGIGGDVVDGLLAFLHPRLVLGQRDHAIRVADVVIQRIGALFGVALALDDGVLDLGAGRFGRPVLGSRHRDGDRLTGGAETQQRGDLLAVLRVLAHALLQHLPEGTPEADVVGLTVLGQVFQECEHAPDVALADQADVTAFLQDLARDVERQVAGVDHTAHEAQVGRDQLLGVVHDEDAPHVQAHSVALLAIPQVEGGMPGDVEQLGVLGTTFHPVVGVGQRPLEVMGDVTIELVVFLLGDLVARALPQGLGLVDDLPLAGVDHLLLLGIPLLGLHAYRQRDVVGIAAHQLAQLVRLQQRVVFMALFGVGIVVTQVQRDGGAALGAGDGLDGELAVAGGHPADGLVLGCAGTAAFHRDLLGHDERGIEAHAELADEVRVAGTVASQLAEELARAGAGDGAQVLHGLVTVHADAVVTHADGARLAVGLDPDAQIAVATIELVVVQGLEAQLVAGVGGVGDQLAQEDVTVAVEGVDHQIKQLLDLGLESQGFLVGVAHGAWWFADIVGKQIGATPSFSRSWRERKSRTRPPMAGGVRPPARCRAARGGHPSSAGQAACPCGRGCRCWRRSRACSSCGSAAWPCGRCR